MSYRNLLAEKNYKAYVEEKKKISEEEKQREQEFIDTYQKTNEKADQGIVDPFEVEDFKGDYPDGINMDEPFAYLRIPKLDKHMPIYLDATDKNLARGLGQIAGTSLPVGGVGNRSVIAGHRGWWGDTMFLYIHTLKPNDRIYIDKNGKTMTYEVASFEVIDPSQWQKLLPVGGEDMITLLTCEPFAPPRPFRLLVNAKRLASEMEVVEESPYILETPAKIELIEEDQDKDKTNTTTRRVNLALYAITFILILGLVFTLGKFIKYLLS